MKQVTKFVDPKIARNFMLPRNIGETTWTANSELSRTTKLVREPEQVDLTQIFPAKIIEKPRVTEPVINANLWIDNIYSPSSADIGKFWKIQRSEILSLLPEGLAGELPRDLILTPSRTSDMGIMLRRATFEITKELQALGSKTTPWDARGWLLDGKRGVGKSSVLSFVVAWARKQGWMVIFEPLAGRFSRDIGEIKRSSGGIFMQNGFAQSFLERTAVCNKQFFEKIPCNMKVYGRRSLDGSSVRSTRKVFFPLVSKAVDAELESVKDASEESAMLRRRLQRLADLSGDIVLPSMVQRLPKPSTVWDIVEFGIQNESFSTQAVAELFSQLKVQTSFPLLVAADEFNETLPVSQYVSKRYDGTKFNGFIPGYHLSMGRVFSKFQAGTYARGVCLFSTSWKFRKRRYFRAELLGAKEGDVKIVKEFTPAEYSNFVAYYHMQKILYSFPRDQLEYFYMCSQGNGFQVRKLLSTLY